MNVKFSTSQKVHAIKAGSVLPLETLCGFWMTPADKVTTDPLTCGNCKRIESR